MATREVGNRPIITTHSCLTCLLNLSLTLDQFRNPTLSQTSTSIKHSPLINLCSFQIESINQWHPWASPWLASLDSLLKPPYHPTSITPLAGTFYPQTEFLSRSLPPRTRSLISASPWMASKCRILSWSGRVHPVPTTPSWRERSTKAGVASSLKP